MILQIEPTEDIKKIKHAYAVLSKIYHPEEHPEEFKEIQEAYKAALSFAKRKSELGVIQEDKTDTNISDQKEKQAAEEKDNVTDDYYEDLFKSYEIEKQSKIKEQGIFFKHKISYLILNTNVGTVEMWRNILKREEFNLAVYDSSFIQEMINCLKSNNVSVEILFEIYYYFVKNKKKEDWSEYDVQLNNYLLSQFFK